MPVTLPRENLVNKYSLGYSPARHIVVSTLDSMSVIKANTKPPTNNVSSKQLLQVKGSPITVESGS